MKSFITTLFVILATATTAMAQHIVDDYAMQVNTIDGKVIEYRFNIEPVVSFNDGQMIVETNEDAPVRFILDDVTKITFSGRVTGIGKIVDKGSSLSVSVSSDVIIINGLKPLSKVSVYGANGALLFSAKADAKGYAAVNVRNLSKGVSVVHTPANSFKFTK